MGMLPIDLQTLYTQLDKIGKTQVHNQLAAQNAQESNIVANKIKSEKKLTTVQKSDAGNEHTGIVHEKNESDSDSDSASGTSSFQKAPDEPKDESDSLKEKEIITDPTLGTHIDISG